MCIPFRDVAVDAALSDPPSSVRLHCGHTIDLCAGASADINVPPMPAERDQFASI
ncbi:MAG: hypothetical protein JF604_27490 [Bradyrhizobium sp.]|nr:hypothetical protein [Bradyrhizobium sp.]